MTENTLANVAVKYKGKSGQEQNTTFEEFLKVSNELLSENEIELKEAMSKLYQLNDRHPPLFKSFPERTDKKKLILDATTLENCSTGSTAACYSATENKIQFENMKGSDLLKTLAHELKHAEQFSSEMIELDQKLQKENGLAYHQLKYLVEAQAFAFEEFIEQISNGNNQLNWDGFQKEVISKHLKLLSSSEFSYRTKWDIVSPIDLNKDTDITANQILESFNLSDETKKEILNKLKEVPKEPNSENLFMNLLEDYFDPKKANKKQNTQQRMQEIVRNDDNNVLDSIFVMLTERYESFKGDQIETADKVLQTLVEYSKYMKSDKDRNDLHFDMMEFALQCNNPHILNKLISAGLNIEATDLLGNTGVMKAYDKGNVSAVKELINAGADLNKPFWGNTMLIDAVENQNIQMIDALIEGKADLNKIETIMGNTALIKAVENADVQTVEKLINAGADITIKDSFGKTALDIAKIIQPNPQILSLLEQAKERQEKAANAEENQPNQKLRKTIEKIESKDVSSTAGPVQTDILLERQEKGKNNEDKHSILGLKEKIKAVEKKGVLPTAEPVQNNILTAPPKKDTTNTVDTNILIQQKIENLKE